MVLNGKKTFKFNEEFIKKTMMFCEKVCKMSENTKILSL